MCKKQVKTFDQREERGKVQCEVRLRKLRPGEEIPGKVGQLDGAFEALKCATLKLHTKNSAVRIETNFWAVQYFMWNVEQPCIRTTTSSSNIATTDAS